jgi:hypothetical protein
LKAATTKEESDSNQRLTQFFSKASSIAFKAPYNSAKKKQFPYLKVQQKHTQN